jgi:hypothetical protein
MKTVYKIFMVLTLIFLTSCFSQGRRAYMGQMGDPSNYSGLQIYYNGNLLNLCTNDSDGVDCFEIITYSANTCPNDGDHFIAYDIGGNQYCVIYVPDFCEGVECDDGYTCEPISGDCVVYDPEDPCEGVNCPIGEICVDGDCVSEEPDLCNGINCGSGGECISGACACFAGYHLEQGVCVQDAFGFCDGLVCSLPFVLDIDSCTCVECIDNSDCAGSVCNLNSHTCVECTNSSHCSGTNDICSANTNICVECINDYNCNMGESCQNGSCVANIDPVPSTCGGSSCPSSSPYCYDNSSCVECLYSSHCSGLENICNTNSHQCVQCTSSDHCNPGEECVSGVCNQTDPTEYLITFKSDNMKTLVNMGNGFSFDNDNPTSGDVDKIRIIRSFSLFSQDLFPQVSVFGGKFMPALCTSEDTDSCYTHETSEPIDHPGCQTKAYFPVVYGLHNDPKYSNVPYPALAHPNVSDIVKYNVELKLNITHEVGEGELQNSPQSSLKITISLGNRGNEVYSFTRSEDNTFSSGGTIAGSSGQTFTMGFNAENCFEGEVLIQGTLGIEGDDNISDYNLIIYNIFFNKSIANYQDSSCYYPASIDGDNMNDLEAVVFWYNPVVTTVDSFLDSAQYWLDNDDLADMDNGAVETKLIINYNDDNEKIGLFSDDIPISNRTFPASSVQASQ